MKKDKNVKYLPASKVYIEYGIPRNLLRAYAEEGKIRTNEIPLPQYNHPMRTYCVEDIVKVLNG